MPFIIVYKELNNKYSQFRILIIHLLVFLWIFLDARTVITCYGSNCIRRVNELGQPFNYYESPDYPQLYEDRLRIQYLLYLPGVAEICFEFDQQAFGIEDNKDELYVGPGLSFTFDQLDGQNTSPEIFFFENRDRNGVTPDDFCVPSDTVWMYFLTDKNIMEPGFRLFWNVAGEFTFDFLIYSIRIGPEIRVR